MKRTVCLALALCLALGLSGCSSGTGQGTPTPEQSGGEVPEENEVDLIAFVGQSNMLGRDTELYEAAIPEGMAFWYSYDDEALYKVENPVGESSLGFSKSSGSSMIPKFCEEYINETGRRVVCVLFANGGVPISYFDPEGSAVSSMEKYLTNCQKWLADNGYTVNHRFYVMLHGETDSADPPNEDYGEAVLEFHRALKDFFDYEFGALILNGGTVDKDEEGVQVINRLKVELAQENEDIILASTAIPMNFFTDPSWVYGDTLDIHLTKDAIQVVGSEAAASIAAFMADGVDPVDYLPLP